MTLSMTHPGAAGVTIRRYQDESGACVPFNSLFTDTNNNTHYTLPLTLTMPASDVVPHRLGARARLGGPTAV